jgi:type II secretory pathway pseudopilin PulG
MPDTLPNRRQQGTALIIALVILASVTLLAVSAVNTSVSEIKMAVNEQLDMEAFQLAQSTIDAAIDTDQAFSGILTVGDTNTIGFNDEAPFTEAAGEYVAASVTRTGNCLAPPRLRGASSLTNYSAFTFRVTGTVDKRATRQGAATLSEGVVILGPKC